MKIHQTFWSKPLFEHDNTDNQFGGYNCKRDYFTIWMLSMLELKKNNIPTVLHCDSKGKKILIDILKLPYDIVSIDLDHLKDFPKELWVAGKLHSYGSIREPFYHIDGDFIFFSYIPKLESVDAFYGEFINVFKDNKSVAMVDFLKQFRGPTYFHNYLNHLKNKYADINCGFIATKDFEFMNSFAKDSFNFISKNMSLIYESGYINNKANNIIEQALLSAKIRDSHKKIYLLNESKSYSFYDPKIYNPYMHNIIHFYGNYKKSILVEKCLNYFKNEYPDYQNIIDTAINMNIIE